MGGVQDNLGVSYREEGQVGLGLGAADAAVQQAERLGDRALKAQALAGRAEIRTARGEPELAIREAERAVAVHRELKAAVLETEAQRILAVALGTSGKTGDAAHMLRSVVARPMEHGRPLLVSSAQRDPSPLTVRDWGFAAA